MINDTLIRLFVARYAIEQYYKQTYDEWRSWDWTASIYDGQPICKHEYEYGFPPPDRIGVSYIRDLRALLESLGIPLK